MVPTRKRPFAESRETRRYRSDTDHAQSFSTLDVLAAQVQLLSGMIKTLYEIDYIGNANRITALRKLSMIFSARDPNASLLG
jgi:hypothetical protein